MQMGSLYKYTIKLLLVTPLENWGITAIRTTFSRPRLLKTLLKSRLNWRTASRRTFDRNLFFLQHRDSLALASFCSSQDLTQINCNKVDQTSQAPQHIALLLLQRHQRCGQSCGVQSHQQLMTQWFRHWTNALVYLSPPSVVIQFSLSTTSNLHLPGQLLHR